MKKPHSDRKKTREEPIFHLRKTSLERLTYTMTLGSEKIPFTVLFGLRRKKIAVEIDRKARVVVQAPFCTEPALIEELVRENIDWIVTNRNVVKKSGIDGTKEATVRYGEYHIPILSVTIPVPSGIR